LPVCNLVYDGKCELTVVVDIHGVEKELEVLIDTGFTTGSGYAIKLPSNYANFAMFTGTGYVKVADGRLVAAATIPDAKIVQIGKHKLKEPINLPALFMDGFCVIGVYFLQNFHVEFDGPKKVAYFSF